MLPAWKDPAHAPIRDYVLMQAFAGKRTLSIRRGNWKYIDHPGSGGNRYEAPSELQIYALPEEAPDAPGQLYDLANDPGERRNLYLQNPSMVKELKTRLEESKSSGRSRPIEP